MLDYMITYSCLADESVTVTLTSDSQQFLYLHLYKSIAYDRSTVTLTSDSTIFWFASTQINCIQLFNMLVVHVFNRNSNLNKWLSTIFGFASTQINCIQLFNILVVHLFNRNLPFWRAGGITHFNAMELGMVKRSGFGLDPQRFRRSGSEC